MRSNIPIGLVVPTSDDRVPSEGAQMYPHVEFVARGVGVRALTPEGYDAAFDAIVPAAETLARQGVGAIMVIGTSLTFYRGFEAHERLLERLRAATGLPVSTMSAAVVQGLRALGATRVCVGTAYADVVNQRLRAFLADCGFEVVALEGFGLERFGAAGEKTEADIVSLAERVCAVAPGAQALLISCGGLRTLEAGKIVEQSCAVPVVSSTPAAFWAALRLVGQSSRVPGYGRLLEMAA